MTTSFDRNALEDVRSKLAGDHAFRTQAGTDLAGTLRSAGLSDAEIGRFHISDHDETQPGAPRALKQTWICEIDGDKKTCHCTNCQNY